MEAPERGPERVSVSTAPSSAAFAPASPHTPGTVLGSAVGRTPLVVPHITGRVALEPPPAMRAKRKRQAQGNRREPPDLFSPRSEWLVQNLTGSTEGGWVVQSDPGILWHASPHIILRSPHN